MRSHLRTRTSEADYIAADMKIYAEKIFEKGRGLKKALCKHQLFWRATALEGSEDWSEEQKSGI